MPQWNKRSVQSFFAKQKENKGTFIEEWENFKFDFLSVGKNRSVWKKTCQEIT